MTDHPPPVRDVRALIERMRSDGARFREAPGGSDVISASTVDEWADELDTLIGSAPQESVRCSGCGMRWTMPEGFLWAGVVHLCGDCWRKVQGVLHPTEAR